MGKLTFLGHSAFHMITADCELLIDPFLTGNPLAKAGPGDFDVSYIILTHAHGDHFGDTLEIADRCKATIISNFEIVSYCQSKGLKGHAMHLGGSFNFPFGRVKLTPAWHGSSFPDGSYGGNPAGVLITTEGKNIYHAGDTALFSDMQLIGEVGLEIALLPIGDNFTMGISDALRAVELLNPKMSIPIHYNTFGVIEVNPTEFIDGVGRQRRSAQIMPVGGALEF